MDYIKIDEMIAASRLEFDKNMSEIGRDFILVNDYSDIPEDADVDHYVVIDYDWMQEPGEAYHFAVEIADELGIADLDAVYNYVCEVVYNA